MMKPDSLYNAGMKPLVYSEKNAKFKSNYCIFIIIIILITFFFFIIIIIYHNNFISLLNKEDCEL